MGDDLLVIKPSNDVPLFTRRASGFCTSSVAIAWFLRNQTAFAEVACVDLKDGPRGIQYCDVVVGKGPMPFEGDVIKCNYEAKLVETGQVVDSAKFFVFGLGNGEVIQGWDLGIGGAEEMPAMAVGGTRKLVVPAELAYEAGRDATSPQTPALCLRTHPWSSRFNWSGSNEKPPSTGQRTRRRFRTPVDIYSERCQRQVAWSAVVGGEHIDLSTRW
eukprot:CAMPEP_0114269776 /NCGR_PEP_ID=MMETSP0058-20121206/26834_1 /TAXON_ID=36894 /ORGANISM="Pyramimonas parkeae, CCMP726" /LENGTH=215 /DNA_ID=CAMNT_0001388367 /DNA_START=539 /DNA_END=1186 /DNA_ORIENTATION=+